MKQRTPRLVDKYCLAKTVTILTGVLFMLGFVLAPAGSAQGASVSELQKQKQDLQNQINQNQQLAQQKQAEADKLQADLFAKEHPVLGTMSETLLIAPVELSPEELERIRKRSEEVMEQATVFTGYAPEPPSEKKDGG